jgi:hypothetical protein
MSWNTIRILALTSVVLAATFDQAFAARRSYPVRAMEEEDIVTVMEQAPLHRGIVTTVFWVGERARPNSGWSDNLKSAWDRRWKQNYGGLDSPVHRKGYFPAKFQPKENPFYVALPFNDITNPQYLKTCGILRYFKIQSASSQTRSRSVCKNTWVEVTYGKQTCYAQWQDVGPIYTDDYNYVFMGREPRAHARRMAGLDISPAMRDYLKLPTTVRTNWRFVDESNVPPGPWKTIVTRS